MQNTEEDKKKILFRGKQEDGKWVEGLYYVLGSGKKITHYIVSIDTSFFADLKVNSETIGRYTALRDKNGTRIFYGDIVKCEKRGAAFHHCVVRINAETENPEILTSKHIYFQMVLDKQRPCKEKYPGKIMRLSETFMIPMHSKIKKPLS